MKAACVNGDTKEVNEGCNEVHPWMRKLTAKGFPLLVAHKSTARAAVAKIMTTDGTESESWVSISLYDQGTKHPIDKFQERIAMLGCARRLFVQIPNFLTVH